MLETQFMQHKMDSHAPLNQVCFLDLKSEHQLSLTTAPAL
jgi:hypothetical protein